MDVLDYRFQTYPGCLYPCCLAYQCSPKNLYFLWLMANNKTFTRDNLAKRKNLENLICLFYAEPETINHLFFECCVPTTMWCHLSDIFDKNLGANFESVARWWVSNKKNTVLNTCCAALMWCSWKLRNDLCFQGKNGEARRIYSSN